VAHLQENKEQTHNPVHISFEEACMLHMVTLHLVFCHHLSFLQPEQEDEEEEEEEEVNMTSTLS